MVVGAGEASLEAATRFLIIELVEKNLVVYTIYPGARRLECNIFFGSAQDEVLINSVIK